MTAPDPIEFYRRHAEEARERMESARTAGDYANYADAERDYQNYAKSPSAETDGQTNLKRRRRSRC